MKTSSVVRGASLVNGEFEVGFDEAFERRWVRAEKFGRWVLVVVVALAMSGVLGGGPLGHASQMAQDGSMSVDYERLVRTDTPTQITLHLHPQAGAHVVSLHLSKGFLDPMGMQTISPQPSSQSAQGDGLILTLQVDPGAPDSLVHLGMKPPNVGWGQMDARLDDGKTIHWIQGILP